MTSGKDVDRFLGICLGGAKSDRTCVTVIDFYRKQEKAFVLDVFEGIGPIRDHSTEHKHEATADEELLHIIREQQPDIHTLAVDVPLTLPPCLVSCEKECKGYDHCSKPEVRWMHREYKKIHTKHKKFKHPTPYSQRPVEIFFRYRHPDEDIFTDETMGANIAPLTARMQYLQRHIDNCNLIEVWPRLALFHLQKALKLSKRDLSLYRHIEQGMHIREKIIDKLIDRSQIFIYERDHKKFIQNISCFDSLICAWTALQYGRDKTMQFKGDLPVDSGWVEIPEL